MSLKILCIRFSSIGDIILTSPVVRCLKKQLNAEVHFLTKKGFVQIIESSPYISKIHAWENLDWNVLKAEKFDYIIDLHKNLRSLKTRIKLGVKTYSFNKLNFEKWLMVNFKINKLPNKHLVDRYFEGIESLKVENDGKGLDQFIAEGIVKETEKEYPFINDQNYDTIVIGGTYFTKRLPATKWIELLDKNINLKYIILGGKEDIAIVDEIVKNTKNKSILNLVNSISLLKSMCFIKKSKKVYTNDTGLMHVAAAFQKEIVSFWGNTIPEFGMYPYCGDNTNNVSINILQVNDLSCRPCSKIGFNSCPQSHFNCMKKIEM